jgi:hypothetical protein
MSVNSPVVNDKGPIIQPSAPPFNEPSFERFIKGAANAVATTASTATTTTASLLQKTSSAIERTPLTVLNFDPNTIAKIGEGGGTILPLATLIFALVFAAIVVAEMVIATSSTKSTNWADVRCEPQNLILAPFYGYNATENFNYCMKNSFNDQMKGYFGPMFGIFSATSSVLGGLIGGLQSVKVGFATLLGGVQNIIQEFVERLKMFFIRVQITSQRMKMLMYRIWGVVTAAMYIGSSMFTSATNFSGTIIFKFLDTFCFDPTTLLNVEGKGQIQISAVQIGDILLGQDGHKTRVVGTFRFHADGQEMVDMKGLHQDILVSTNHYIQHNQNWIRSGDHPNAIPTTAWSGGTQRPLICLNTEDNTIPIAGYTFRDYDETKEGDEACLEWISRALNGGRSAEGGLGKRYLKQMSAVHPDTEIRLLVGSRPAGEIQLGDILSTGSRICGVFRTEISESCTLPTGERVASGTLIFDPQTHLWRRAGDMYDVEAHEPILMVHCFALSGSTLQTVSDVFIRDYMEVCSPDTEKAYSNVLESSLYP